MTKQNTAVEGDTLIADAPTQATPRPNPLPVRSCSGSSTGTAI
ncbi:hypothetical protein OG453_30595 [Streptomyces sp. NBC_01381]|nr:hypothetical protein [Streptomyces sp. NBC_01381]MCX4670994.1 hypothetical protein [Streptomyces sp. NBC_01381]